MEELIYSFGCIAALVILPILFFGLRGVKRANRELTERVRSLETSVAELRLGMVTDPLGRASSVQSAEQSRPERSNVVPETAAGAAAGAAAGITAGEPQTTPAKLPAVDGSPVAGQLYATSTTSSQGLVTEVSPRRAGLAAPSVSGAKWGNGGSAASVLAPLFGWFTKMHLMVQIGLLILFIGVAFLIKFVADQGLLSIELRLMSAAVIGVGLTGIGWRLRNRAKTYGMALMGGGLAIDYLTTYGALLYTEFPPTLAFPLFVGLGIIGAVLAVLANAQILAFLSIAGAFLAPILASTGEGSHITLFSYYAIVNVGILALAWFKTWRSLNVVGYTFTMIVGLLWGLESYTSDLFASTEFFLIFFFLLYVLIAVLFAARKAVELTEQSAPRYRLADAVDVTLVFGNPLAAFSIQSVLMQDVPYGMAISTFAAGVMYALLAVLFVMRWRSFRPVAESFLFLAGLFIALSVPLTFEAQATAAVWAVMGLAWVWAGSNRNRTWQMLWGVLIQIGSALALISSINWLYPVETVAFVNGPYLGAVLIALAGYGSGYLIRRNASSVQIAADASELGDTPESGNAPEPDGAIPVASAAVEDETVSHGATSRLAGALGSQIAWPALLAGGMTLWAHAWWFISGIVQVADFVSERDAEPYLFAAGLAFVAMSAGVTEWIGARLRWSTLRLPILLLMPALLLGVIAQTGLADWPLQNGGWYAWPIGLGVAIWALYRWDRFGTIPWFALSKSSEAVTEGQAAKGAAERRTYLHHLLGLWTVTWLLAWIGSYAIGLWSEADGWSGVAIIGVPTLLVWIIQTWGGRMAWPLGNRQSLYQKVGSSVMLCVGYLLIWGWNTTSAATEPLPYLPLLNPADLIQIGFFVLAFVWVGRHLENTKRVAYWIAGIGAFFALNAGLARAVHHLLDVPYQFSLLADSSILQSLYAVAWSLLALVLMFQSHRKGEGWRSVWIGGAMVLALTVIKLFAIDLANSGTIARIVSFIGTGALIIVIAYFAPVPPRSGDLDDDKTVDGGGSPDGSGAPDRGGAPNRSEALREMAQSDLEEGSELSGFVSGD